MQKRRISTNTDTFGAGAFKQITVDQDETDVANFHGWRFCFSLEPENADANSNGCWCVWCLPGGAVDLSDLPTSIGALGNEDFAPYIWGTGCWTASNQAPYHMEFIPKTSRNCQKGARIVFRVIQDGISAGNARVNMLTTGFTSS